MDGWRDEASCDYRRRLPTYRRQHNIPPASPTRDDVHLMMNFRLGYHKNNVMTILHRRCDTCYLFPFGASTQRLLFECAWRLVNSLLSEDENNLNEWVSDLAAYH
ncbi:hypothetical protein AVEN_118735-1 [Araneus ventricosus]|uniref:Uncharacterized protein n=1 Tax=Araneus ventricosus TaxID=182803 RepID=A0A4Y2BXI0_ARAVE|nr:hypothetical protein AVEN_118735-1 [Araneus ventricosus]